MLSVYRDSTPVKHRIHQNIDSQNILLSQSGKNSAPNVLLRAVFPTGTLPHSRRKHLRINSSPYNIPDPDFLRSYTTGD